MKNFSRILSRGLGTAVGVGGIGGGLFVVITLSNGETSLYLVPWVRVVWMLSALAGGFGAGFAAHSKGWLAGGLLGLFWGSIISLTILQVIPDSLVQGLVRTLLVSGCLLGAVGGIAGINYRDWLYNVGQVSMSRDRSKFYRG